MKTFKEYHALETTNPNNIQNSEQKQPMMKMMNQAKRSITSCTNIDINK